MGVLWVIEFFGDGGLVSHWIFLLIYKVYVYPILYPTDLSRMYNLFSRVPSTLETLRFAMNAQVKALGEAIVQDQENRKVCMCWPQCYFYSRFFSTLILDILDPSVTEYYLGDLFDCHIFPDDLFHWHPHFIWIVHQISTNTSLCTFLLFLLYLFPRIPWNSCKMCWIYDINITKL